MKDTLPKYYNRRISRAIAEFNLLEDGDQVVVGLSGGKDSTFLLYALEGLRPHLPIDFSIEAVTVDLGFEKKPNYSYLKDFCRELNVEYNIIWTDIANRIKGEDSPCAKCSYFKKGALIEYMEERGYNKLAFGHHYDDAVETYVMSLFYSGQLLALQPKRIMAKNPISIIRPLIYIREEKIKESKELTGYRSAINPCPYSGKTKREEIKNLLRSFSDSRQVFYNIAAAMREDAPIERWPASLSSEERAEKIKNLWNIDD